MVRPIDDLCEGLLEEACIMWERDEGLMTTSFVIGHSRSLFAQPVTEDGLSIDPDDRVRLHAMLASAVGAVYLGRIDESFIAERPASAAPLRKGDLERMARHDPSVRTALVVQATDARSGDSVVSIATPIIQDDGEIEWEYESFNDAEGQIISDAIRSLAIAELMAMPSTDAEVMAELRQLGWTVADSDRMGSEADEDEEDE